MSFKIWNVTYMLFSEHFGAKGPWRFIFIVVIVHAQRQAKSLELVEICLV